MPTVIIRSLAGRVGTVCVAAVVLAATVLVLCSAHPLQALAPAGWGGLLCVGVWALWWAPSIEVAPGALTVRNGWRTHVIDWRAVEGCQSRWVLDIVLAGGRRVRASAAQRGGGLAQSARRHQEVRARRAGGSQVPDGAPAAAWGDLLSGPGVRRVHLHADAAAQLVEAYRDELAVRAGGARAEDHDRPRDGEGVVSEPRWAPVTAAALFAVVAVASLF